MTTTIKFDHPKGAVVWTTNGEGLITASEPNEDYTGCRVLDHLTLTPGEKPRYETPERKVNVLFDYPIATIKTR